MNEWAIVAKFLVGFGGLVAIMTIAICFIGWFFGAAE